VVSIGNLSVGGAGKTPFAVELGGLLQQQQFPFDVLSRGYGRSSRGVYLVEEDGTPEQYGEEPLLIARKLHVPVIVGEDRRKAGAYAELLFGEAQPAHGKFWLHLLDDGFQHRQLRRQFDIVLLGPEDFSDTLLPWGRLREPLSSLQRADAVVLPESLSAESLPIQGKQIWRVSRELSLPPTLSREERVLAFCGIARPQHFFRDLRGHGLQIAAEMTFPDHHRYSGSDIDRLLRARDQYKAHAFLTTEKDEINLGELRSRLSPLYVAPLRSRLLEPESAMAAMLETISRRWKSLG
jgi:tetraacyldisaccharide 4'-kinase